MQMKFFTDRDFVDLIRKLLISSPVAAESILNNHLALSEQGHDDFLLRLNYHLEQHFKAPKNIHYYGYESNPRTPPQINFAYLWIFRKQSDKIQNARQVTARGTKNPGSSAASSKKYTHRERAIAHNYKVSIGREKQLQRREMHPKKFEQAFDSLNPLTKSGTNPYRKPTIQELNNVIEILQGYPEAKELAETDLSKAQS